MPSTTDYQPQDRGIFALFKGESGAGKSVGALSFPKPYVLDHDRKMPAISLKHFPGKEVSWNTFDDVFQISDALAALWENCPYETIIGDSVTSLSYTALKSIDDVKGQNIISMLQNVKKTKGGSQTIELRGYDYYNGEDNFLKYYIDLLKAMWARPGNPKNVILIAHVLTSESLDIKGKVINETRRIVTAGQKIAAYIPAQFDDVWSFAVAMPEFGDSDTSVRHICCTEAVGRDSAKTALTLPAKIDFTHSSLYDEIQNILGHHERELSRHLTAL